MNKKYIIPSMAAVFIALLFIKNSEITVTCVQDGLKNCFLTIIPSLFPFMVISETLNNCGALDILSSFLKLPAQKIFGISGKSLSAVLSGLVLGFPIGTRALTGLYDRNEVSEEEFRKVLGFCGIPSFSFTVNVVGAALFSNRSFGFAMYAATIVSAILTGAIFSSRKKYDYEFMAPKKIYKKGTAEIITESISAATKAIIILCAYVIFFSCISGCISQAKAPKAITALVGVALELSTGTAASADLGGILGIALCGFTLGWSGLSVHFQTMALVSTRIKSYSSYYLQKFVQGLFCTVFSLLFATATDFYVVPPVGISAFAQVFSPEYTVITFIIFFMCISLCKKNLFEKK